MTKVCPGCREPKPATADHFHRQRSGLHSYCRPCRTAQEKARYRAKVEKDGEKFREKVREQNKARYHANPEKARKRKKAWYDAHPEQKRAEWLRRAYGLTLTQYDQLRDLQGGACAICRKESNSLHVDHNHATGAIRGLLCRECNIALGLLGDSAWVRLQASQYLSSDGTYRWAQAI